MISPNTTNINVNGWSVLFNVPNTICWIRIVLLFISIRHFGQRNYISFIICHTMSGLVDSFDGILARSLHQNSFVGQFLDYILDQYAHLVIYVSVGFLYPSYIIYFFLEIALELWNSLLGFYIHTLPKFDHTIFDEATFLSTTCTIYIWQHPNFRWVSWYGPDVFHALLVIHYSFTNNNNRKLITYIKRYIPMSKVNSFIRFGLILSGACAMLRTILSSCFMIDKLHRMAQIKSNT